MTASALHVGLLAFVVAFLPLVDFAAGLLV
jgi:hypothetical protein